MTPGDWFNEWVGMYCDATGSNEKIRAVLLANRHAVTVEWGATLAELGECVSRLVSGGRVPAFPTEVTNALRRELNELRAERAHAPKPDAYYSPAPPLCTWCRDTGLVTVPHWRCVHVPADAPPYLVAYRDGNVTYTTVVTGSVLCDRPGCGPGRAAREKQAGAKTDRAPRPCVTEYAYRRCAGLSVPALLALLDAHERARAAGARQKTAADGDVDFRDVVANVIKRAAGNAPREDAA